MKLRNIQVLTFCIGFALLGVLEDHQVGAESANHNHNIKPKNAKDSKQRQRQSRQTDKDYDWDPFSPSSSPGSDEMNLLVTIAPKNPGEEINHEDVDELNLDMHFDDGSPPARVTIANPTITDTEDGKHQVTIKTSTTDASFDASSATATTPRSTTGTSPTASNATPTPLPLQLHPVAMASTASCNCPDIDEIIDTIVKSNAFKGERGDRGTPGLSIQGPKGEPGVGAPFPYHLRPEQGPIGPRGPPGFCTPNDCSRGGSPESSRYRPNPGVPPEKLYKIVPGALVFPTRDAMLQMEKHSFVGTVGYVEDEERFYGRVKNGWKSFMEGYTVSDEATPSTRNNYAAQRRPEEEFRPRNCNGKSGNCFEMKTLRAASELHGSSADYSKPLSHHWKHLFVNRTLLTDVRLVALNSQLTGNMGGPNQINYQCQRQALKNNLHGVFRALHLIKEPQPDIMTNYLNLKNESILPDNKLYSFNGKGVGPERLGVWTRRTSMENNNCRGWSSNNIEDEGLIVSSVADALGGGGGSRRSTCDKKHIVICIEILHMDQISLRHRNSNRVRLSFDRYLAILKGYDEMVKEARVEG